MAFVFVFSPFHHALWLLVILACPPQRFPATIYCKYISGCVSPFWFKRTSSLLKPEGSWSKQYPMFAQRSTGFFKIISVLCFPKRLGLLPPSFSLFYGGLLFMGPNRLSWIRSISSLLWLLLPSWRGRTTCILLFCCLSVPFAGGLL